MLGQLERYFYFSNFEFRILNANVFGTLKVVHKESRYNFCEYVGPSANLSIHPSFSLPNDVLSILYIVRTEMCVFVSLMMID